MSGESSINELILLPNFIQDFLGTNISKTEFFKTIKAPTNIQTISNYRENHALLLEKLTEILKFQIFSFSKDFFLIQNGTHIFNITSHLGYKLTNIHPSFNLENLISSDTIPFDKESKIILYKSESFENILKTFLIKDFLGVNIELLKNNPNQENISTEILTLLRKMLLEGRSN